MNNAPNGRRYTLSAVVGSAVGALLVSWAVTALWFLAFATDLERRAEQTWTRQDTAWWVEEFHRLNSDIPLPGEAPRRGNH